MPRLRPIKITNSNDYAAVTNSDELNPASTITISLWVNVANWTDGHRRILQKGYSDNQYRFYALGENLDLDLHTLLLKSRRPLTKVEYLVTGDDGSLLGRDTLKLKPGKQIKIAWKQKPGKVLKIQLIAHDTDGIFEDLELIPWSYAIPHEEVEFETGKWDIRTTEAPKLDRSYKLLKKGLAKYGKLLQVKLYIAGYTDTVAAADYNQNLSDKRALSIARHLRAKGFGHPIFYQGFGERGLKVPTPDETDEPKNRRAEYVLAAEPPPMDVPGSSSRWKRLQ